MASSEAARVETAHRELRTLLRIAADTLRALRQPEPDAEALLELQGRLVDTVVRVRAETSAAIDALQEPISWEGHDAPAPWDVADTRREWSTLTIADATATHPSSAT
ncbi:hypothetical protein CDCA_CDCA06G1787 [Cyanidium caldarium]|uniref:Uncharacterized protein n=1 Tax=Cyanidium caldarium TaxID=2771 RepID=A0AAV9IU20_CYACA|nr:hypothetical protein CDCA_CDCA06G1787 [Cyanidium caldarium]